MERLPGDGRQDALMLWNAQKDDLLAGREPRVKSLSDLNPDGTPKENRDVLTLRVLCNQFLGAKVWKKRSARRFRGTPGASGFDPAMADVKTDELPRLLSAHAWPPPQ